MPHASGHRRAWVAALAGGVSGTAAMTLALDIETRLADVPADTIVDYDSSDHVVIAASKVVHWRPRTDAQRKLLFNVVHWGYGSAVALEYEGLRRALGGRGGALAFYAACQSMAFTLFPLLGETPPPWRWKRSVLVSSLVVHAIYVGTVAKVSAALRD